MRHVSSGGIFGKPFKLQLVTATGKNYTLESIPASRLHTRIMSTPKGPKREEVIRKAYEEFTGESVSEEE